MLVTYTLTIHLLSRRAHELEQRAVDGMRRSKTVSKKQRTRRDDFDGGTVGLLPATSRSDRSSSAKFSTLAAGDDADVEYLERSGGDTGGSVFRRVTNDASATAGGGTERQKRSTIVEPGPVLGGGGIVVVGTSTDDDDEDAENSCLTATSSNRRLLLGRGAAGRGLRRLSMSPDRCRRHEEANAESSRFLLPPPASSLSPSRRHHSRTCDPCPPPAKEQHVAAADVGGCERVKLACGERVKMCARRRSHGSGDDRQTLTTTNTTTTAAASAHRRQANIFESKSHSITGNISNHGGRLLSRLLRRKRFDGSSAVGETTPATMRCPDVTITWSNHCHHVPLPTVDTDDPADDDCASAASTAAAVDAAVWNNADTQTFIPVDSSAPASTVPDPQQQPSPTLAKFRTLVRKQGAIIRIAGILMARVADDRQAATAARTAAAAASRQQLITVNTERKAVKVLGAMFALFVACWTPFFCVNLASAQIVCREACHRFDALLFKCFLWLGYLSSVCNPIIYTVFNKAFKRTFLRLLTTGCCDACGQRRRRCARLVRREGLRARWSTNTGAAVDVDDGVGRRGCDAGEAVGGAALESAVPSSNVSTVDGDGRGVRTSPSCASVVDFSRLDSLRETNL